MNWQTPGCSSVLLINVTLKSTNWHSRTLPIYNFLPVLISLSFHPPSFRVWKFSQKFKCSGYFECTDVTKTGPRKQPWWAYSGEYNIIFKNPTCCSWHNLFYFYILNDKNDLEPSVNSINSFQTFPRGTGHLPSHLMCYEMVSITMWSVDIYFGFAAEGHRSLKSGLLLPKKLKLNKSFSNAHQLFGKFTTWNCKGV